MADAGPALRLASLVVRRGGVTVLDGVDLALPHGRVVVLGPNGAGKTTLLQAIHGLVAPDAGRVRGVDAHGAETRLRFGFVFQRPAMLRRTARANVTHALAIAGVPRAGRRALADAALADVGLAALADRPAPRLSGGEQQRLAIARAEALAPDVLLLDEPTASLDPAAAVAIERHLAALSARGRGIVMATHDLALARRFATFVVLLHRGRVVEAGDAAAFFAAPLTGAGRHFLAGDPLQ